MKYIAAIDQGTGSTRCIIFDYHGNIISQEQLEHTQLYPKIGWVEHDPAEIWDCTQKVIRNALSNKNISKNDIAATGITNQRETTVIWNKHSGTPYYNAIVWQDTRTDQMAAALEQRIGSAWFREKTGLPISSYFSSLKICWLLENIKGLRKDAEKGDALFGNIDSFLVWQLTGGVNGGLHLTDVTNASRTQLMNLDTADWDDEILQILGIPKSMLPGIKPSSCLYGKIKVSDLTGVIIGGVVGDQQSALIGQACFEAGEAKNTYGTGCFMLMNTGKSKICSASGLLTTIAYQFDNEAVHYALEGSVSNAGATIQWLRSNLGLISDSKAIEDLAASVADNGGVYFVPAFSGLFAPYWDPNARGIIAGLTGFVTKAHIARAALESTAYQSKAILDAMQADSGIKLKSLKVDGGMVVNELLMQFQSDILQTKVIRPKTIETTSLGAAYLAGFAVGFWKNKDEMKLNWKEDKTWVPMMSAVRCSEYLQNWNKAVEKSRSWLR
ncbi:MAG: glycerol kinase GlpK [Saprospiraceae bacterium]